MERPRTLRICSYGRLSMRRPSKRTWPPLIRPGGSSKPMIAAPVSDFPAPDSPTTPRISPGAIEKLTPSSATNRPRRPANSTWRLSTSSSGDGMRLGRRRRRAPAHGLFVVHSDVEIRGELVGAHCHQVIPCARPNVERDLALEPRAAGAARRALDDDLANAGIDQDGTKGRVLAVDPHDRDVVGIDRRAEMAVADQLGVVVVRACTRRQPVSYTHLRAHETDSYLVCR